YIAVVVVVEVVNTLDKIGGFRHAFTDRKVYANLGKPPASCHRFLRSIHRRLVILSKKRENSML
ncbi:MAG: hypothetical protein QF614_03085, partial [SAR324 cluster bacterium]|nr:hypothetical protein [SAR324 cluster bacterium]